MLKKFASGLVALMLMFSVVSASAVITQKDGDDASLLAKLIVQEAFKESALIGTGSEIEVKFNKEDQSFYVVIYSPIMALMYYDSAQSASKTNYYKYGESFHNLLNGLMSGMGELFLGGEVYLMMSLDKSYETISFVVSSDSYVVADILLNEIVFIPGADL